MDFSYEASNIVTSFEDIQMKRDLSTVILDARSKEQFEAGHIPGAINIPVLQFFQDGRIKSAKEIKDTFV